MVCSLQCGLSEGDKVSNAFSNTLACPEEFMTLSLFTICVHSVQTQLIDSQNKTAAIFMIDKIETQFCRLFENKSLAQPPIKLSCISDKHSKTSIRCFKENDLLGDDASISIELVAVSPGLGIANEQGQDLFNAVGDTYLIGQGDHFSFTPIFYASPSTSDQNYSASFRLIDTNTSNNRTPWLSSGTFSINVQTSAVPEPSNFVGALAFVGMMGFFRFYKKIPK
jgi:hypothetical protein